MVVTFAAALLALLPTLQQKDPVAERLSGTPRHHQWIDV